MRTYLLAALLGLATLSGAGRAETLYFIHVDHLNTPRLAVGEDLVERWRWDQAEPFGYNLPLETMGLEGYLINLPLRYPGQYADKETGLHYSYLRDCYDAGTGRFCQADPIGLEGGINLYVYVENDPLSYTDPYGLRRGGARTSPNTAACTYYQKVCSETGCRYYCYTAPMVCRTADFNPLFMWNGPGKLNCVRKCLIEEDQKARAKNQKVCAPNQPCLSNRDIDDYHQQCFTKCQASGYPGIDPSWWPGPSLNPGQSN